MSSPSVSACDLIRGEATDGYPTDYLLARIKGRRAALIADWRALLSGGLPADLTDERIWRALVGELAWLHQQMNPALREIFTPFFGLFEIKTIVLCLRNRTSGRTAAIEQLLERSLLADHLCDLLRRDADLRSTIGAVVQAVTENAQASKDVLASYEKEHLKGLENALMRAYLERVAAMPLHPAVKTFFVLFTDLRNIMLLAKQLRWESTSNVAFIAGGSLEPSRFQEILARKDKAEVEALVTGVTGHTSLPAAATEAALETNLLRSLTRTLEQLRRADDEVGVIVAYIWRVYAQARNLALLYHGKGLDADTLARELIL